MATTLCDCQHETGVCKFTYSYKHWMFMNTNGKYMHAKILQIAKA